MFGAKEKRTLASVILFILGIGLLFPSVTTFLGTPIFGGLSFGTVLGVFSVLSGYWLYKH